jgi:predicted DNA-binding protein
MNTASISSKKEKVNFLFPSELNTRAIAMANMLGLTYSDFVRQAVAEFVERIERENINREITEACKCFYETDKQLADEWRSAETRI